MSSESSEIQSRIDFVLELDRLKSVERQSLLIDGSRRENSAEHSWYLAVLALTFISYVDEPVNLDHVIRLVLIHDIVEIDAGDAFCYDQAAQVGKLEREQAAAQRIFGLLPPEQGDLCNKLWDEFESGETPEARFANALDRLAPFLQNANNGGLSWKPHKVTRSQVLDRIAPIKDSSRALWDFAVQQLDEAVARGEVVGE